MNFILTPGFFNFGVVITQREEKIEEQGPPRVVIFSKRGVLNGQSICPHI